VTGSAKLQADLFLQPKEDGLFPGFTQTRASGTMNVRTHFPATWLQKEPLP
jgi:hypothetical protein